MSVDVPRRKGRPRLRDLALGCSVCPGRPVHPRTCSGPGPILTPVSGDSDERLTLTVEAPVAPGETSPPPRLRSVGPGPKETQGNDGLRQIPPEEALPPPTPGVRDVGTVVEINECFLTDAPGQ